MRLAQPPQHRCTTPPADATCCCAGLLQIKNSTTRNLHRLTSAIRFIQLLFERLVSSSKSAAEADQAAPAAATITLREAASSAYEEALAPIHTTIVRVSNQLPALLVTCTAQGVTTVLMQLWPTVCSVLACWQQTDLLKTAPAAGMPALLRA